MSYSNVAAATDTVKAQVGLALLKQAAIRSAVITDTGDQREREVCRQIIDTSAPPTYVTMVLIILDIAGQLPSPTDAQVDTAITTANTGAWNYIVKSRT